MPVPYTKLYRAAFEDRPNIGLHEHRNHHFVREATGIEIGISEFSEVAEHYPIIFDETGDGRAYPRAVFCIKPALNLFVDDDGSWLSGAYIPRDIAHYPFTLATPPDDEYGAFPVLAFNDDPDHISDDGTRKLFNPDGTPTDFYDLTLDAAKQHKADRERATLFGTTLLNIGLFDQQSASFETADIKDGNSAPYLTINEQRLSALPSFVHEHWGDDLFNAARYQIASQQHWDRLLQLHEERF